MRIIMSVLAAAMALSCAAGAKAAPAKVGPNSQRVAPLPTCEAYPGTTPDLGGLVFRAPLSNCDIADMTIAVYEQGYFRPAYGKKPVYDEKKKVEAREFVDPVIERLRKRAAVAADEGKPLRILLFAHGGMVSHESAVESAENLAPAMLSDGFAPVFLVWNSDFGTAYVDRLCCVRDGVQDKEFTPLSTAGRLFGDVASSVTRSPQNFGGQALRFRDSVIARGDTKYYLKAGEDLDTDPNGMCAALQTLDCPTIVFPPYRDEADLNDRSRNLGGELKYTVLLPARAAVTLIGPEAGANAWNNMVRRTRMPFQRTTPVVEGADAGCVTRPDPKAVAGFAVFFDRLACELIQTGGSWYIRASDGRLVRVELHLYGHSMGALVANEALWLHPELPWAEVVYMAAASTIRDFRLTAVPALKRHPKTRFYNLVLHPLNESRELFMGGVAPQGSLLEWIDEMFEGPRSPDERTLGKWNNLRTTMTLVPGDVRDRITIRVFAMARTRGAECRPPDEPKPRAEDGRCHPVAHGEFNEFSFWRRSYLDGVDPAAR